MVCLLSCLSLLPVFEGNLDFPLGFPEQGEVHKADDSHPEAEVWGRHSEKCGGAGAAARSWAQNGSLGHEHRLGQRVWDSCGHPRAQDHKQAAVGEEGDQIP